MSGAPDSPGIRFPPPLLFVGCVAAGFALDAQLGWRLTGASGPGATARELLGAALLGLGLLLDFAALALFLRARTNPLPFRPATTVVSGGPYRFTRNPMYLGMTLTCAGFGLLVDVGWVVLAALVAALATDRWIVPREESYLERRFGDAYRDYQRRVRRWL